MLIFIIIFYIFVVNHYHRSLCILLPQLEHAIRKIYVAVNNLPPQKLKAGNYTLVKLNFFQNNRILFSNDSKINNFNIVLITNITCN